MTAPGLHAAVPFPDYLGWDALSNSGINRLRRSPAHYRAYMDEPQKEAKVLLIGRAAHTAVLEPDDFEARFTHLGQCEGTKKDETRCTSQASVLHLDGGHLCGTHVKKFDPERWDTTKEVLTEDRYRQCIGVRDAVYAHPYAAALLNDVGDAELSGLWDDAAGPRCKLRADKISQTMSACVDLKTTRDAGLVAFERAIFQFGYHRQGAMYKQGLATLGQPVEHFIIIAAEKEPPYGVAIYNLSSGALLAGAEQLAIAMARFQDCTKGGEWPGYPTAVQEISLPKYAWSQLDEEKERA